MSSGQGRRRQVKWHDGMCFEFINQNTIGMSWGPFFQGTVQKYNKMTMIHINEGMLRCRCYRNPGWAQPAPLYPQAPARILLLLPLLHILRPLDHFSTPLHIARLSCQKRTQVPGVALAESDPTRIKVRLRQTHDQALGPSQDQCQRQKPLGDILKHARDWRCWPGTAPWARVCAVTGDAEAKRPARRTGRRDLSGVCSTSLVVVRPSMAGCREAGGCMRAASRRHAPRELGVARGPRATGPRAGGRSWQRWGGRRFQQ